MKMIYFLLFVFGLWLFDKICLWLEARGYLYYRKNKPKTGLIGAGLEELNAQLMPSRRQIVVAQSPKKTSEKSNNDKKLKDPP